MDTNKEQSKAEKVSDNAFIEVVRKKIRKANKKMQRITALEASLKTSGAKINEEQKILLDSKETTTMLLKEFYDLQTQMTKIDEQTKGSVTGSDRKDREARKEKKKQKELESNNPNTSNPVVTKEDSYGDEKRQDKPQVQKENVKSEEKKQDEPKHQDQSQHHNQREGEHGQKREGEHEQEGETKNGREKKNQEWVVQKEIYVNKYKQNFGPEQENQFVAIIKGELIGPYMSIQDLKKAHGDVNLNGAFYAKIGHEDEPLLKGPRPHQGGSRGRGYSNPRRGNSDRGNSDRGGRSSQQNRT